jgi:hypothetical protein
LMEMVKTYTGIQAMIHHEQKQDWRLNL